LMTANVTKSLDEERASERRLVGFGCWRGLSC
jgi:hypothetical protein